VLEDVYAEGIRTAMATDQEKMMDAVQTAVTREVSTLQTEVRLQLDGDSTGLDAVYMHCDRGRRLPEY